jgi:hypothetical protein
MNRHAPHPVRPALVLSAVALLLCAGLACGARQHVTATPADDSALREFIEQVEREWPGESHQQALTADSLMLLATAIVSVAERRRLASPDLLRQVEALREQTGAYRASTPGRLDQTERLRRVFIAGADIVDGLVEAAGLEKRPVDPRLSALRRAAESLDPALVPLRQPDVIERYFHHAAEALKRVDRGA